MRNYENQRPSVEPPKVSLRDVRASHGLTQELCAEKVMAITDESFTKGALSAIEKGHRGASSETLSALEVVLHLPAGSLIVEYEPNHNRRKLKAVNS